ncbi:MAG: hypothetical protein EA416_12480 [Trueperaceae bacterium]|nr:MAG: hypothetical protein EA416_12480 [Trueperaceae bacterium]
MSRQRDVVASAPQGGRFWLWNQRVTVAVLAGVWPFMLVAEALGFVESGPSIGWLGQLLGAAVFAWVTYWIGFAFTLRLELTGDGQVRWFGAFRQGSIDVADIHHISTDAAPFLWTVHHASGRLLVALATDMKPFLRTLDEGRADGDSPPQGECRTNEPRS